MPSYLSDRAEALLDELFAAFPIAVRPKIVWKNLRVSAGLAYYTLNAIGLSRLILTDEEKLRDTLAHEYAHLLAIHRHGRKAAGHGPAWRKAMADLGADPKVHHSYAVRRNAKRQEVGYKCRKCGATIVRTRRLPSRRKYVHAGCGGAVVLAYTAQITTATLPS